MISLSCQTGLFSTIFLQRCPRSIRSTSTSFFIWIIIWNTRTNYLLLNLYTKLLNVMYISTITFPKKKNNIQSKHILRFTEWKKYINASMHSWGSRCRAFTTFLVSMRGHALSLYCITLSGRRHRQQQHNNIDNNKNNRWAFTKRCRPSEIRRRTTIHVKRFVHGSFSPNRISIEFK